MTVKELRDALPYNADDAEVLIAPPACQYGFERAAAAVMERTDSESGKSIIIVATADKKNWGVPGRCPTK